MQAALSQMKLHYSQNLDVNLQPDAGPLQLVVLLAVSTRQLQKGPVQSACF